MKACNGIRRFFHGPKYLGLVGLLLGALACNPVNAQTAVADSAFNRFMSSATGAGKTTVSFGSGGVPLVSQGVPTLATDGTSKPLFSRMGTTANPSGNPLAVTASGRIAASKFVPLLIAGAKLVPTLGTGIALYEMFNELGFKVTNSGGQLVVQKPSIGATCNGDYGANPYPNYNTTKWCVPISAGSATYIFGWSTSGGPGWPGVTFPCGNYSCVTGYVINEVGYTTNVTPVAPIPSSEQELIDAIAVKSQWPASSNLSPAIKQAQELTGQKLEPESITLTGPATSPGTTSTIAKPDGSTETKTTSYGHTYNGDTITTVTNSTVNNFNPTTNITETTTTTEEPVPQKTACELDPKSIGCQDMDVPVDKVPTRTETVSWTEENLGLGSGSCPAPYTFATSNGSYALDLSQYCTMLSNVVKPIVLAMALLAAFFIVAPVKTGV